MFEPMPLDEFYAATLKQNGFVPPKEDIEKVAEVRKVDVEVVKIARVIFDQLTLDKVPYEDEKAMLEDSFKLAGAYLKHVEEAKAATAKLATDLHRVARHAIEGYLAQHGVKLDAQDGLKIAAIHGEELKAAEATAEPAKAAAATTESKDAAAPAA